MCLTMDPSVAGFFPRLRMDWSFWVSSQTSGPSSLHQSRPNLPVSPQRLSSSLLRRPLTFGAALLFSSAWRSNTRTTCCSVCVYDVVQPVLMSYGECECLTLKLIFGVLVWSGSGVALGGSGVGSAPDTDGDGSSDARVSSRGESTPGGASSSELKLYGFSQLDSARDETNGFRKKRLTLEKLMFMFCIIILDPYSLIQYYDDVKRNVFRCLCVFSPLVSVL